MNHYPSNVKEKLNSIILSMAEHHWLFSKNPGHDFTRQHLGKLSFYDTMRLIISMGKGSTNDEIMDYFDLDPDLIPSQSAFCQRRRQISLSAFEYLFSEFSSSFPSTTDKFKDHCILACDGCHVVYATNSDIIEDYNKPRLIDYKGYNHMHLNGFVDVISKAFLDVVIQPGQQPDEREALHSMLDHFTPDDPQKYIITADRGYESYDLLFHCELKNLGYVFRVKSPSSPKSILSYYASELPDDLEEFDVTIKRFFTDKATNIMKNHQMFTATSIPVKIPLIFMSFSGKTTVIFISCSFALLRSKLLRIHMNISLPTFPSHLHWTISRNAITGDGALKFLSAISNMRPGFCTFIQNSRNF